MDADVPPDDDGGVALDSFIDGLDGDGEDLLGEADALGGLGGEDLAGEDLEEAMLAGGVDDSESDAEPPFDDSVGELPAGLDEEQLTGPDEVDLSAYDELELPQVRRIAQLLATNESLSEIKLVAHSLAVGDLKEEDELEWDSEDYTDVEAIIIAELLRANTTVKRLDLARNQIGDAGACALAAVLSVNDTIEYLNLENNTFGERAGNAFMHALHGNSTLQYLNLMYNSVPTGVQDRIKETWSSSRESQGVGLHL
jgi:hypothetical protein